MCFSAEWFEQLLLDLVYLGVFVALVRLLLPWVLGLFGVNSGVLMQAVNIIIAGAVAIFVIVLIFGLLSCLGGGFPLLRH